MINQDLLNRLVSLLKQNIIVIDDVKNADYKTAAQQALTVQ